MARGDNIWWLMLLGAAGAVFVLATQRRSDSDGQGSPGGASGAGAGGASSAVDPFATVGVMTDLNTLTASNSTLAQRRAAFGPYFDQAEQQYGIPSGLLLQQGIAESALVPSARSTAGAVGIMQMLPRYFPGAGADALADINTGAAELARLYQALGSWTLALAGYNAGQSRVEQYGGVPPFPETVAYVRKITAAAGINEPGIVWA